MTSIEELRKVCADKKKRKKSSLSKLQIKAISGVTRAAQEGATVRILKAWEPDEDEPDEDEPDEDEDEGVQKHKRGEGVGAGNPSHNKGGGGGDPAPNKPSGWSHTPNPESAQLHSEWKSYYGDTVKTWGPKKTMDYPSWLKNHIRSLGAEQKRARGPQRAQSLGKLIAQNQAALDDLNSNVQKHKRGEGAGSGKPSHNAQEANFNLAMVGGAALHQDRPAFKHEKPLKHFRQGSHFISNEGRKWTVWSLKRSSGDPWERRPLGGWALGKFGTLREASDYVVSRDPGAKLFAARHPGLDMGDQPYDPSTGTPIQKHKRGEGVGAGNPSHNKGGGGGKKPKTAEEKAAEKEWRARNREHQRSVKEFTRREGTTHAGYKPGTSNKPEGPSKGHMGSMGDREVFERNGEVYLSSPGKGPLDTQGYRMDARWESSKAHWDRNQALHVKNGFKPLTGAGKKPEGGKLQRLKKHKRGEGVGSGKPSHNEGPGGGEKANPTREEIQERVRGTNMVTGSREVSDEMKQRHAAELRGLKDKAVVSVTGKSRYGGKGTGSKAKPGVIIGEAKNGRVMVGFEDGSRFSYKIDQVKRVKDDPGLVSRHETAYRKRPQGFDSIPGMGRLNYPKDGGFNKGAGMSPFISNFMEHPVAKSTWPAPGERHEQALAAFGRQVSKALLQKHKRGEGVGAGNPSHNEGGGGGKSSFRTGDMVSFTNDKGEQARGEVIRSDGDNVKIRQHGKGIVEVTRPAGKVTLRRSPGAEYDKVKARNQARESILARSKKKLDAKERNELIRRSQERGKTGYGGGPDNRNRTPSINEVVERLRKHKSGESVGSGNPSHNKGGGGGGEKKNPATAASQRRALDNAQADAKKKQRAVLQANKLMDQAAEARRRAVAAAKYGRTKQAEALHAEANALDAKAKALHESYAKPSGRAQRDMNAEDIRRDRARLANNEPSVSSANEDIQDRQTNNMIERNRAQNPNPAKPRVKIPQAEWPKGTKFRLAFSGQPPNRRSN